MTRTTAIERYLAELGGSLRVRGAARRRFLRECRHHLEDAAVDRGEAESVRAFGPPDLIAAAFDSEIATHRTMRATLATVVAVAATAGSTLVLLDAADPGTTAPALWAVVFFVAAQLAGVATGLAVLQALVARRDGMSAPDAVLLARRNACALLAGGLTMFAAGAALPGQASAPLLLAGPVLVCCAWLSVLRARAHARRLDGARERAVRPPLVDLRRLTGAPVPLLGAPALLAGTVALAATVAFVRDLGERATVGGALVTAAIEASAVVGCFVVLGPALGLWRVSRG